MKISDLVGVLDEPFVIVKLTEHSYRKICDTRKDKGEEIPFDIMEKEIYKVYVDTSDIYADELAVTIEYEEV